MIEKINIGDFVESKLTSSSRISDSLYQEIEGYSTVSFNPKSYQLEHRKIIEISKHKADLIYEIILDDNSRIKVTKDHNCFRMINCNLELCSTDSLKVGDYLPVSSYFPAPKKPIEYINLLDYNPDIKVNISNLIRIQDKFNEEIKSFLKEEFEAYNWKFDQILKETSERGITTKQMTTILHRLNLELSEVNNNIRIITKGNDSLNPLIYIDESFLTFVGLYLSEGHCTDRYILISNSDKNLQEICQGFFKSKNLGYNQRNENDIVYYSKIFSNFFRALGKKANEKRIISFIYNLSNDHLSILLRSMFDGDGWVDKNGVNLLSASNELIFDIKNLLLRFNIISRVKIKREKHRVSEKRMLEKEYYHLIISGTDNLGKYNEKISFSINYKKNTLEKILVEKKFARYEPFPNCSNYIKKLREKRKLSQSQLADYIGCERSFISMIESDNRIPSKDILKKILSLNPRNKDIRNLLKINYRRIVEINEIKPSNGNVFDISVEHNENFIAGRGNIFVHNTFTIANVIEKINRPTLVISHNKTLAAQLYQEFKEYFPNNAVEYFVSFYDYYQPEAYLPTPDRYIEKEADINAEIDKMRASTTRSLLERNDVLVIASVSCIYGLGKPEHYKNMSFNAYKGMQISKGEILSNLIDILYERNEVALTRGKIRTKGDIIDVWPVYEDNTAVRIELFGDEIERIAKINPLTGKRIVELDRTYIFPAKHYVRPKEELQAVLGDIRKELCLRLRELTSQKKLVEAQRLQQRTQYDLEMIDQIGYAPGMENYSRYFDGRQPGEPPSTLFDFFPDDYLLIIDEEHQTIPQIGGMREGDLSRKKNLVEFGFRLPSSFDHRPLTFNEFEDEMGTTVFLSATPGPYALHKSGKENVVEQIIRPTGLVDPEIIVKMNVKHHIDDLVEEIQHTTGKGDRTLVTTLTKRMAENLADYFDEIGVQARYLHSEIKTLERTDILRSLRLGEFDVLVGINLLREGLDLPEVSLVAILDADKQGFLRNERALIQTIGRASRNVSGRVLLYADKISESMEAAIRETKRRRRIQIKYNEKTGLTPQTIRKDIRSPLIELQSSFTDIKKAEIAKEDLPEYLNALKDEMHLAAKNLEFEKAAEIRDMIIELEKPKELKKPKIIQRKVKR
jgi:excinuclease ABC B subunit